MSNLHSWASYSWASWAVSLILSFSYCIGHESEHNFFFLFLIKKSEHNFY